MGSGPSKNVEFEKCYSLFSSPEKDVIEHLFHVLCQDEDLGIQKVHFKHHVSNSLTDNLAEALYACMARGGNTGTAAPPQVVSKELFVIALAHILKGSMAEKAQVVAFLASNSYEGPVTVRQLRELVHELVRSYERTVACCPEYKSWSLQPATTESMDKFAKRVLYELVYRETAHSVDAELPWTQGHSVDDIERWLSQAALIVHMLDYVFHQAFPLNQLTPVSCAIPLAEDVDFTKVSTLLDLPSVLLLNFSLMPNLRRQWRFLYSTRLHGESFNTFLGRIIDKGPSLLLIRDADGNVFGGFASDEWSLRPQFVGDSTCFLFMLNPNMEIFNGTEYNENYMYLNTAQTTMPNGLGMGGQFGHHGLWLDADFGRGHSIAKPKCTTYGSPQLSGSETFNIETLEVWGVGRKPEDLMTPEELAQRKAKGSILDKDPEAKAMLALIDKGPVSEGLRDEDMTADIPEEHQLPPM